MARSAPPRLHSTEAKTVPPRVRAAKPRAAAPPPPAKTGAALAPLVERLHEHLRGTDLVQGRTQQVGARLPAGLVREAKRRTGLDSNTELLAFALANLAVEDRFAEAFEAAHGKLNAELDIGL